MDEALLEADVFRVPEAAVGIEGGRVVGADVEHDLVAHPQQLGGHGTSDGGREAASTVVDVGQDVPTTASRAPGLTTCVRAAAHQLAVDAHP